MKTNITIGLAILALFVIAARVTSWFVDFNPTWDSIIVTSIFGLVGLSYIIDADRYSQAKNFVWLTRICGVYIFSYIFLPRTGLFSIIGILAMVLPRLIGYFEKRRDKKSVKTAV